MSSALLFSEGTISGLLQTVGFALEHMQVLYSIQEIPFH